MTNTRMLAQTSPGQRANTPFPLGGTVVPVFPDARQAIHDQKCNETDNAIGGKAMDWKRLILTVLCLAVADHANAATIELVNTVHSRPDRSVVQQNQMLKIHFVDVGGGDAILIETPSGRNILIDGGYTYSERPLARKEYAAYIQHYVGNDVIDLIVISHPDYDHFAGLSEVIENYKVLQVWASGYDSDKLSLAWRQLRKSLIVERKALFLSPLEDFLPPGSRILFDNAGTPASNDDTIITIVNTRKSLPSEAYGNSRRKLTESQRRNSSSIVLRLDYGETSFLFTGDVNGRRKKAPPDGHDDQEKFMVDGHLDRNNPLYGLLDVDVLKVPHHGSDGSSSLPFLEAVSPTWAVILAGAAHGHPDQGVLKRLGEEGIGLFERRILRTDADDIGNASESNLGDDTFVFWMDPQGIVKIEQWDIKP